jgi:hypothetical protein
MPLSEAEAKAEYAKVLAMVQENVLADLRPVEIERESILKELTATVLSLRESMVESDKIEASVLDIVSAARDVSRQIRKQPSMAGSLSEGIMGSFELAVSIFITSQEAEARKQMVYVAVRKLVDSLVRLGRFYNTKFALAWLSGSPLAISVSFDKGYNMIQRGTEFLGTEKGFGFALDKMSEEVAAEAGQLILGLVRTQMAALSLQAYGGNYAAPLTASGQLADAVGILESGPQRRYRRGKGAIPLTHVVTVGVRPDSGRPAYYGAVLARAIPSRAPMIQYGPKVGFGRDAWGRLFAWGSLRGHSKVEIKAIAAKIWREGTYGRSWMSEIARQTLDISSMRFLASRFAQDLEEIINKGGAT